MKRARIKGTSKERAGWLETYRLIRDAQTPKRCARCRIKSLPVGWKHLGGSLEPHHPFRRETEWALLAFIPFCHQCHEEVEHQATQARADGWIVDYRLKS